MAIFQEKRTMIDGVGTFTVGSLDVEHLDFGTMRLTGPGVGGPSRGHDDAATGKIPNRQSLEDKASPR
jgi:hypothetical protein